MDKKRNACVDCELFRGKQSMYRCKAARKKFDPINGVCRLYIRCSVKNKTGHCRDFQPKPSTQDEKIEETIMPDLFPFNMSACTKYLEPGEIFTCDNGMKITTECEPGKPWWKFWRR